MIPEEKISALRQWINEKPDGTVNNDDIKYWLGLPYDKEKLGKGFKIDTLLEYNNKKLNKK